MARASMPRSALGSPLAAVIVCALLQFGYGEELLLGAPDIASEPMRAPGVAAPSTSMAASRQPETTIFALGYQTLFGFNISANSWAVVPGADQIEQDRFAAVATSGGYVFIFGSSEKSVAVARWDAYLNTWTPISAMPQAASGVAAVAFNGLIYVMGGATVSLTRTSTTSIYDPSADAWTTGPSMLYARANAVAVALYQYVYVLGGTSFTPTVERLNPAVGTWAAVATMSISRSSFCAVTLNGFIFALGGYNTNFADLAFVERYDPELNSWTTSTSMNVSRSSFAATTFGGNIVVMGGKSNAASAVNSVEMFDFLADEWSFLSPMPTPESGLSAVAMTFTCVLPRLSPSTVQVGSLAFNGVASNITRANLTLSWTLSAVFAYCELDNYTIAVTAPDAGLIFNTTLLPSQLNISSGVISTALSIPFLYNPDAEYSIAVTVATSAGESQPVRSAFVVRLLCGCRSSG